MQGPSFSRQYPSTHSRSNGHGVFSLQIVRHSPLTQSSTPSIHTGMKQSSSLLFSQGGQTSPPQSTPVSLPSLTPFEQVLSSH